MVAASDQVRILGVNSARFFEYSKTRVLESTSIETGTRVYLML